MLIGLISGERFHEFNPGITAVYVSEIYINGFRCFGPDNPLALNLRRGLNILVGPNDAGKTAVIDAARSLLWTRGDDILRLDPRDFHVKPDGSRVGELFIRCTFDQLTPDEQARFLEWCSNESGTLRLHVCLRGTLRKLGGGGETALTQYRAGKSGDGHPLDGDLREYLKSTYLRPLRDAERELRSGRRSRLSRILGALPAMAAQADKAPAGQPPTLLDTMRAADANIETNTAVQGVQSTVNDTYLDELSFAGDALTATLGLGAKGSFDQLLERLELYLNSSAGQTERLTRGLGYNNLLFMAAELLLLQSHPDQVPFLLIEEPEAHLHPQHQTLFMQMLEARTLPVPEGQPDQQVQVLLTTHSPQLAASADLDAMVMIVGQRAYPLGTGHTKLAPDDYAFLRRFLDATKANLFFARGVIVVEGDAENILLPALAKKMGRGLGKSGVSIINVGHRGLFRYSRILQRGDGKPMPVPVGLMPDRDIPPDCAKALVGADRKTEGEWQKDAKDAVLSKLKAHEGGAVKSFPSEQWTLEFDLARRPALAVVIHQAVQLAKGLAGKTRADILSEAKSEVEALQADQSKTSDDVALVIFEPIHKKQVSKTEVSEQLAALIEQLPDGADEFRKKLPPYIVSAIDYVTSPLTAPPNNPAQAGGAANP
ncbi:chromosome segregation protein SMC [Hyphomicrobium nitrativorans NL23]|uniref:Chromosome segregation protein SMC n=1 Tax=Hyphomicrobium nitrativorans NL23 TaxID=1029756 RepID=V5SC36_9HYPH|nr:chromosome segregation protein SMC [Hyphomicrobium nitrativorans NL23]